MFTPYTWRSEGRQGFASGRSRVTSTETSRAPATLRSRYHHGNLRQALIDTGLQVTRTGGPAALTLRELARRLGISPNAVYRHFADRDTLLAAVKSRVQFDMAARMADETGHQPDAVSPAVARLRAVGLGYIDFALQEPGWFEVAFTDTDSAADTRPSEPPPPLSWLLAAMVGLVE